VTYLGATPLQEQEITIQRKALSDALVAMIAEVKVLAAHEDAIFVQESFLNQYFIKTTAELVGVYQGGKSLVTGIYDLAALSAQMHQAALSAATTVMQKLASGDIANIKPALETLLAASKKQLGELAAAFELMLNIADDQALLNQLATFPYDYLDAHSIVEKKRMGGVFAFEILLAIFTAGAGTVVSTASKSKHLTKANSALKKLARLLERKKLNRQKTPSLTEGANKDPNKIDKPKVELEEQPKIKPKAMKKHEVACFKKNKKGDMAEYDRQLNAQQSGLNKMTAKEYLDNRKAYAEIGRKGTGKAQANARAKFKIAHFKRKEVELRAKGLRGQALLDKASELTNSDMKTLHALHNPDMVAGGNDVVFDLGDAGVNQSIGSQWKTTGSDPMTRVELIDIQAEEALAAQRPDTNMNVDLQRCK
jgi:hypothetical protein